LVARVWRGRERERERGREGEREVRRARKVLGRRRRRPLCSLRRRRGGRGALAVLLASLSKAA
jgi:hypothetical protein